MVMCNVLMCCSDLSVKGGMVSVVKNYLEYEEWDDVHIKFVPTHIEANKIGLLFYFFYAYMRILWLICRGGIDIAHLHMAERGSFYRKAFLLRTFKRFGIKTIIHHHGAEFDSFYKTLSPEKQEYVNSILEKADLNIVLSNRLIPMIKDKAPNAKVEVLYNAVNTYDKNPYDKTNKNILFLGRLGERKGIYDFLQAIKSIDKEIDPQIKFFLCGDGDIDGVKRYVDESGIQSRIAYVGWIDGKQKIDFFSKTMIHVLPSYNEGLPMSILETMAYGIPNISTSIASIPEVIDNDVNGILINPGDIASLSVSLLRLIKDDSLRIRFSENSYSLIKERFSMSSHVARLKSFYYSLNRSENV